MPADRATLSRFVQLRLVQAPAARHRLSTCVGSRLRLVASLCSRAKLDRGCAEGVVSLFEA